MLGSIYVRIGLGLAVAVAIALAFFAVKSAINKIDAQGQEIAMLRTAVASEKAAREKDVAGLTALSQGVVAAASARAIDDKILSETIDAKNPQPSSPGLARFLDGLRASDSAAAAPGGPAGAPPAPRAGAAGPAHKR
jgi:hypothetical protein